MDSLNAEQRRRNMQANRATGTMPEVILAKALWRKGYRYRKNNVKVTGKPDITFKRLKIAIFCDGEFWHGKDWDLKKGKIESNKEYWVKKIERNMMRDRKVNEELARQGWTVIRFWGKDIKKDIDTCIRQIEEAINQQELIHDKV